MEIQRWQLNANAARSWLEEDEEGDWVKHSEATAQIERMREALKGLLQMTNNIEALGEWEAMDINRTLRKTYRAKVDAAIAKAKSALERE